MPICGSGRRMDKSQGLQGISSTISGLACRGLGDQREEGSASLTRGMIAGEGPQKTKTSRRFEDLVATPESRSQSRRTAAGARRCDNGPEFISEALRMPRPVWASTNRTCILSIGGIIRPPTRMWSVPVDHTPGDRRAQSTRLPVQHTVLRAHRSAVHTLTGGPDGSIRINPLRTNHMPAAPAIPFGD